MEFSQSRSVALLRNSVDSDRQFARFTYNCLHSICLHSADTCRREIFARFLVIVCIHLYMPAKSFATCIVVIISETTINEVIAHKIYTSDSYFSKSLWNLEIEI